MGDLQATIEFLVELHKFYNVDLFIRGNYQLRLTFKPPKCAHAVQVEACDFQGTSGAFTLFPSFITNDGQTAVSRTFNIYYKDEEVLLKDVFLFKVHLLIDSTKAADCVEKTTLEMNVDVHFTDQVLRENNYQTLPVVTSRTLQFHFSPFSGLHHQVPLLFDYYYFSVLDIIIHANIVSLDLPDWTILKPIKTGWFGKSTTPRSSSPLLFATFFGNRQPLGSQFYSDAALKYAVPTTTIARENFEKAAAIHRNLCAILAMAHSELSKYFEKMMGLFDEKMRIKLAPRLDPAELVEELCKKLETLQSCEQVFTEICSDLSVLNNELSLLWFQFQESFALNDKIQPLLREKHHLERMLHFSEAFFVHELPWKSLLTPSDSSAQNHTVMGQCVKSSRYLALIPPVTVECAEVDGDSTTTPIFFEDRYVATKETHHTYVTLDIAKTVSMSENEILEHKPLCLGILNQAFHDSTPSNGEYTLAHDQGGGDTGEEWVDICVGKEEDTTMDGTLRDSSGMMEKEYTGGDTEGSGVVCDSWVSGDELVGEEGKSERKFTKEDPGCSQQDSAGITNDKEEVLDVEGTSCQDQIENKEDKEVPLVSEDAPEVCPLKDEEDKEVSLRIDEAQQKNPPMARKDNKEPLKTEDDQEECQTKDKDDKGTYLATGEGLLRGNADERVPLGTMETEEGVKVDKTEVAQDVTNRDEIDHVATEGENKVDSNQDVSSGVVVTNESECSNSFELDNNGKHSVVEDIVIDTMPEDNLKEATSGDNSEKLGEILETKQNDSSEDEESERGIYDSTVEHEENVLVSNDDSVGAGKVDKDTLIPKNTTQDIIVGAGKVDKDIDNIVEACAIEVDQVSLIQRNKDSNEDVANVNYVGSRTKVRYIPESDNDDKPGDKAYTLERRVDNSVFYDRTSETTGVKSSQLDTKVIGKEKQFREPDNLNDQQIPNMVSYVSSGDQVTCFCGGKLSTSSSQYKLSSEIDKTNIKLSKAKQEVKAKLRGCWSLYSDSDVEFFVRPYFMDPKPDLSSAPVHFIICVHGLDGNSGDLRLLRCFLEMALPSTKFEFLMSEINQDNTFLPFDELTEKLVSEILHHIEAYRITPSRISFIGHSLGNIIIRSALTHPLLEPYVGMFHTFLSLSGPHLGMIHHTSSLVSTGLWLMQKLKKSASLLQLSLNDSPDLRETFLYKLSKKKGLEYFTNVLLVSSVQDHYVPFHSSRIELPKSLLRSNSQECAVYREMMENILTPLVKQPNRTLIRYSVYHCLPSSTNSFIGRAAHIAMLDSELFIEKLICRSAAKYFQ